MTSAVRRSARAFVDDQPSTFHGRELMAGVLGRLAESPRTPVVLLALLVAGLALTLMHMTSRSQHQIALTQSQNLVETVLNSEARELGRTVSDHAYLSDAVTHLSGAPDARWADDSIGGHAADNLGVSASMVLTIEGTPTVAFMDGKRVPYADLKSRISGGLDQLAGMARTRAPRNATYRAGLLAVDGVPYLAAAAAISAENDETHHDTDAIRPVLVFLRAIDHELLQRLGDDFSIDGLHFIPNRAAVGPVAMTLFSVNGDSLGQVSWKIQRLDSHLIRQTALPVAIAFAAVLVLALVILRRFNGASSELNESVALLAKKNTELSESERLASHARARLESALEYSPEAIAFFDAEARLVICNERFRRLMHPAYRHKVSPGLSLDSFGETYADAWFGGSEDGDGASWLAQLRSVTGQEGGTTEIGMACGRWMLMRERRTADGGFVILCTDITELHGRQKNLTDRSSRLQVTLDTLREGVAVFDPDLRLLVCNQRYAEILGLQKESLRQGTPFEEILPWFAKCRLVNREKPERPRSMPPPQCAEDVPKVAEYETPDRRILKVRRTQAPDGAMVVTFRDVTDRRRSERRLRTAMEQADLTNRSKTEFLANVSHELRTPLNAIIGFSEIMKDQMFGDLGNETYRDYASDIFESGRHLLSVINDILDLSKIELGRAKLNEEAIDLVGVSTSALRIVRERAQAAGITIGIELPHHLPKLRADQRAIKQILINLLSNAIKFTPANGTVTLKGRLLPEGSIELRVEDDGIGIAEKDIPIALAPFGQVDGPLTRSIQGTGLGLPLSAALAEEHGGGLQIESAVGVGTEVIVTFPANRIVQPTEVMRSSLRASS